MPSSAATKQHILAESNALGDDVVVALCTPEKIEQASGGRFLRARRPDLYAKLSEPLPEGQSPEINPGWQLKAGMKVEPPGRESP